MLIKSLQANEIFVFGSNTEGLHGRGAALYALKHFGAKVGQAEGLQGQSYAIPTRGVNRKKFKAEIYTLSLEEIKPYVDRFIEFTKSNLHLTFYLTEIGCGLAGYKPEDIAPMFYHADRHVNIILSDSFIEVCGKIWDEKMDSFGGQ